MEGFGPLVSEAIEPLLDAAKIGKGSRVLDVGTGPGVVAAAVRERGGTPVGLDFSEDMLKEARTSYPEIEFQEGDAASLSFGDDEFDAVVANFVVHHMARPEESLAEARRVLRDGGSLAFTVWADPTKLAAFGVFLAAVEEHAGAAELPHGPLFGVSEFDAFHDLVAAAGFRDSQVEEIEIAWRTPTLDTVLAAFSDWAAMETFPADVRERVFEGALVNGSKFQRDGQFVMPNPAILVSAVK
jgi:SAM-dependent methyltransferase